MFSASRHIFFCSTMTLFTRNGIKLYPPFVISGGGWIEIGGWFVLFGVCGLWRSDIYEISSSWPVGPLIVQESAGISPGNIEVVVVLCKKKTECGYFSGIVPGLLSLGGRIFVERCSAIQSEDAAWWMGTNQVAKPGKSCPMIESKRRWCFV